MIYAELWDHWICQKCAIALSNNIITLQDAMKEFLMTEYEVNQCFPRHILPAVSMGQQEITCFFRDTVERKALELWGGRMLLDAALSLWAGNSI